MAGSLTLTLGHFGWFSHTCARPRGGVLPFVLENNAKDSCVCVSLSSVPGFSRGGNQEQELKGESLSSFHFTR